jgi:hypothetical protein
MVEVGYRVATSTGGDLAGLVARLSEAVAATRTAPARPGPGA